MAVHREVFEGVWSQSRSEGMVAAHAGEAA
jgi:hypothetical protein